MRAASLPFAVLPLCVAAGCGGGSSEPDAGHCNVSYDCSAGQTCWTTNGTTFSCMASGSGQVGAVCDATLAGLAKPSCTDGAMCIAAGDPTHGHCTAWCGGGRTCPTSTTCSMVTTSRGASLAVCLPCNLAYDCPAGQTCWTTDGTTFSCMASGSGQVGAVCDATLAGLAKPSCTDGATCLSTGGDPTMASCVAWCDATHACSGGKTCRGIVTTLGATLLLCQ